MEEDETIKILICGGGIAGLGMGIMLDKLPSSKKIDYLILEKTLIPSPLGSTVSLAANLIPLLGEMGAWERIRHICKPMSHFRVKNNDGTDLGPIDFTYNGYIEDRGYHGMVCGRPDLYKILLSMVPPEKILFGKKICGTIQDDYGVSCFCEDGSVYHGDILVGADGAYSTVRHSLYQSLSAHGNFPCSREDRASLKLDNVVVVGITKPLDPEQYPFLKEDVCQFRIVLGKNQPYSMWMCPLSNNRIGWSIGGRTDAAEDEELFTISQDEAVRVFNEPTDDWVAAEKHSIESICERMKLRKNPFGYGTYGDLVSATPSHLISKVYFEERGYRTWYAGRTVLVGDGVSQALYDVATLVNLLDQMQPGLPTVDDLGNLFQSYYEERYPAAQLAIAGATDFARLFQDPEGVAEEDGPIVMFSRVPRWLQQWSMDPKTQQTPRLHFLGLNRPVGPMDFTIGSNTLTAQSSAAIAIPRGSTIRHQSLHHQQRQQQHQQQHHHHQQRQQQQQHHHHHHYHHHRVHSQHSHHHQYPRHHPTHPYSVHHNNDNHHASTTPLSTSAPVFSIYTPGSGSLPYFQKPRSWTVSSTGSSVSTASSISFSDLDGGLDHHARGPADFLAAID
ncbi:hypothetical protein BGW41_003753 [Actinomortierella wolfii]|nr:hypothetical protein BGW41_003753 [Actinomortierella wolfii]